MAYMLQHWTNHLGAALSLDHKADSEMDRQVYYCLDAPDLLPVGSTAKVAIESFNVRGNHE
jgi:hypothetical protein